MVNYTPWFLQSLLYWMNTPPDLKEVQLQLTTPLPAIPPSPPPVILQRNLGPEVGMNETNRTMPGEPDVLSLTRCYGVFGCYYVGFPWTSVTRPVNLFPEPPDVINPQYCLYTRENKNTCHLLLLKKPSTIFRSSLKADKPVVFITHGYLETGSKKWITRMKNELLTYDDMNVVVIDWVGGSGPPYTQAVANIRLIGVMTAHLIKMMMDEVGVKPELCHIIGHSLGSHLGAYTGQRLKDFGARLGRITGMDPAEPHFGNTDPVVRLDPTDALYVDVVHTDAGPFISGGLGLDQPMGHVDFYPNGGIVQPGCGNGVMDSINKERGSIVSGIRRFLGCNHVRSYEFFIESINTQCPFQAVECSGWNKFVSGKCFSCNPSLGNSCTRFGYHSPDFLHGIRPNRKFVTMFFMTGGMKPFCRYHYRVTLLISNSPQSVSHGGDMGVFYLVLFGDTGHSSRIKLNYREIYFEPGKKYVMMVPAEYVGPLNKVRLEWEYSSSVLNPLTWRILTVPRIHLSYITVEGLETGEKTTFCTNDRAMLSKVAHILTWKNSCVVMSKSSLDDSPNRNALDASGEPVD